MTTRSFIITLALAGLFAAKTARAEGQVEVYMQVKAPDQKDPKTKGKAPEIEATVVGAPKPEQSAYQCFRPGCVIDDYQPGLHPAQVIGDALRGGVLVDESGFGQFAEQTRLPGSRRTGKDQVAGARDRGQGPADESDPAS